MHEVILVDKASISVCLLYIFVDEVLGFWDQALLKFVIINYFHLFLCILY